MKYLTRDFGEVDLSEEDVLEFVQPLYGFEECKRFALLRDVELGEQIVFLQSLDRPEICFTLFDPSGLADFYAPQIPEQTLRQLGEGELACWVVGVVPPDFRKTTVNLKSPVFINVDTKRSAQVILEQDYPVRFLLMKEA